MRVSGALAVAAILASAFLSVSFAKHGYLLTSPKSLLSRSEGVLHLGLTGINTNGQVTARLLRQWSSSNQQRVIAETTIFLSNTRSSTTMRLNVPDIGGQQVQLEVGGKFGSEYSFNTTRSMWITARSQQNTIFIETDKPTYKPGQIVKFRVLPIDSNLKPLGASAVGDIWIETPTSIRVAQWRNVSFAAGMVQLEMDLTEEPPLGYWNIHVKISPDSSAIQSFNVQKYVLPKFDVAITGPPYLLSTEKFLKYKICAKYTYGKPVNGQLKLEITANSNYYHYRPPGKDKLIVTDKIKGCFNYTIDTNNLVKNYSTSERLNSVDFKADVTEQGTGVTRSASHSLRRTCDPVQISFYKVRDGQLNFRPGLPYRGLIEVKMPDSQPAPNEPIKLCLKIKTQHWSLKEVDEFNTEESRVCKKYVTDKQGRAYFTIPPQPQEVLQIHLTAVATKYKPGCTKQNAQRIHGVTTERIPEYYHMNIPKTSSDLKSWFSPSGSQLYVEPSFSQLVCHEPYTVKFQYTIDDGDTTKFYYMVVSGSAIVLNGEIMDTFDADKDQSHYHDKSYISTDRIHKRLEAIDHDHAWENTVVPRSYVGKMSFKITPNYHMASQAQVIVYYIREDGEVVADWTILKIQRCLQNKVSMKFGKKEQYPGSSAALSLAASPSSLCGIGVVDKSVYIMASNNRLQLDKIISALGSSNEATNPVKSRSDNYCQKKYPISNSTHFPDIDFCDDRLVPSEYTDTLYAFESSGVMVMSDLTLEVVPCMLSGGSGKVVPCKLDDDPYMYPAKYSDTVQTQAMMIMQPQSMVLTKSTVTETRPEYSKTLALKETREMWTTSENFEPIVEIRNYFPETWLWDLQYIGPSGAVTLSKELPHTITEWVGNAVCLSTDTGLGMSDKAEITTFQPFFVSSTFPYSVIRGEVVPVTISVFNYLQKCIPVTLDLEKSTDFLLVNGSHHVDLCVCGGESVTYRYMVKTRTIGKVNATVDAYSNRGDVGSVCSGEIDHIEARDAATWKLLVEAEGYPKTNTSNIYICTGRNPYVDASLELKLPKNVIEGSARAYISIAGDLMGPVLKDLGNNLPLPSGCGEQTLSRFAPQIFILDYLIASHRLTENLKTQILSNLQVGYTRELTFRKYDGSYGIYSSNDQESIWLTAAVIRYFGQLRRHMLVDESSLKMSVDWILGKQRGNGCFPQIGKVLHSALAGLTNGKSTPAPLTAYILIALMEAGFGNKSVWNRGFDCLEANNNPSTYELALYAYAAVLSKNHSHLASGYLERLDQLSTKEDGLQYWKGESSTALSTRIETASYVALAYLNRTSTDTQKLTPIIRWIAKNMNAQGGFSSSQDTLIAIQAIAQFSTYAKIGSSGLNVTITGVDFRNTFNINSNNLLLVQSKPLKSLPNHLNINAVGQGCALVQAVQLYNTKSPQEHYGFHISVSATRGYSGNCKKATINVCAGFTCDFPSNMVIIEVRILTGFEVDRDSLDALKHQHDVKLRKYEIKDGKVYLYFDELTSKLRCFDMRITEIQEVSGLQPATVKIYDYYEQEKTVSTSYTLKACDLNFTTNRVSTGKSNRVRASINRRDFHS